MSRYTLYCDGGCRGNGLKENIGGYGGVIMCEDYTAEYRGHAENTTNNIMELTACIEGLQRITDKNSMVTVVTDSLYLQKGAIEWIPEWVRKDWVTSSGKPVVNKDLWIRLIVEQSKFKCVNFMKVKGHSDNVWNNRADELCNLAMDEFDGRRKK